ncbi:transposase [Vibrio sp. TRT 17S01]|uniref:transposase n=1 Tax=Vibrio sp. TRT 17S01 TaxID=3418505 RepID=UPI003CF5C2D4
MRPETLLAKFNLKGLNYEQMHNGGGKGLFSVEEQLAMVGVTWSESPVGFLVLFVEMHNHQHSRKMLEQAIVAELNTLTITWRGQKSEHALNALVHAAIEEAISPLGRVCPTCNGSGLYTTARRQKRNCTHCKEGRIPWNMETRFAVVCSGRFACTYSMFKRYHSVLEKVTYWLSGKRNAAMLALMERIEQEEEAAA